jgi:hypothetical protein
LIIIQRKINHFFREDCFRHPYTRIGTCLLMISIQFCFNAENVVSRSHAEMKWAMVGPAMNFLIRQWPMQDLLWLMATKVGMVAAFVFAAIFAARKYVHPFLREYLQLSMFAGSRGDVCCVLMVIIPVLYAGAQAYNTIVLNAVATDDIPKYYLSDSMSTSNSQYYSHRQTCDWIVCLLTLVVVVDGVLQDRVHFKQWQEFRKHQWITAKQGFQRVLAVWILAGALSLLGLWLGDACFALRAEDEENFIGRGLFGTDEVSQITLCSLLFALRLTIVMQDYEFPQFGHTEDTRIAGTIAQGRFTIYYLPGAKKMLEAAEAAAERAQQMAASAAGMGDDDDGTEGPASPNPRLTQWREQKGEEEDGDERKWSFQIHLDGKWLVYGPLLLMLCLDAHTLYQLLEYSPNEYAQYADPVNVPLVSGYYARRPVYSLVSCVTNSVASQVAPNSADGALFYCRSFVSVAPSHHASHQSPLNQPTHIPCYFCPLGRCEYHFWGAPQSWWRAVDVAQLQNERWHYPIQRQSEAQSVLSVLKNGREAARGVSSRICDAGVHSHNLVVQRRWLQRRRRGRGRGIVEEKEGKEHDGGD